MKLLNLTTQEIISVDDFKAQNPNTSFPISITAEIYEHYGFAPVYDAPQPTITETQKVIEVTPVLTDKGHYEQAYQVIDLTAEELTALADAKAAQLEQTRNSQVASMRQARLALHAQDLLGTVNAAVSSLSGADAVPVQIAWEYATEVKRVDPLVQSLATALSWTAEQLDELFAVAATL